MKVIERECPRCRAVKPVADFRDPGDVTRGRPPQICATCRAGDPVLVERQAANVAHRGENIRQHREDYAARTLAETLAARAVLHPDGLKWCPEVCGCGSFRPIEHFNEDRHQAAGLASICRSCAAG